MDRREPGNPEQHHQESRTRTDPGRSLQQARDHLDRLNGVLERTADTLGQITPTMQRLEAGLTSGTIGAVGASRPSSDHGPAHAPQPTITQKSNDKPALPHWVMILLPASPCSVLNNAMLGASTSVWASSAPPFHRIIAHPSTVRPTARERR